MKRGAQVVHGEKELVEKLGRNDLCPCGSGRRFQTVLLDKRAVRRKGAESLFSAREKKKRKKVIDFRFLFAYSAGR